MPVLAALLAAFIVVPLVEIGLFIQVGGAIGTGWTLGLVFATAIVGTALLRQEGRGTLRRAREQVARNNLPLAEAFDGVTLVIAGALLLTPGFLTDAVGGLLLIPLVRHLVRRTVVRRLLAAVGVDMGQGPERPGGGITNDGVSWPADEPDDGEGRA